MLLCKSLTSSTPFDINCACVLMCVVVVEVMEVVVVLVVVKDGTVRRRVSIIKVW